MSANGWGSDVPVSLPEPVPSSDIRVDMGSHVFTDNGLCMSVSRADLDTVAIPTFAPMRGD